MIMCLLLAISILITMKKVGFEMLDIKILQEIGDNDEVL